MGTNSSHGRIADPWGDRTPYRAGGAWLTWVDTHLADGFTPEQVPDWWHQHQPEIRNAWE